MLKESGKNQNDRSRDDDMQDCCKKEIDIIRTFLSL